MEAKLFTLVSQAYAQTASAGNSATSSWMSFIPIILMIVIFYFLLIRPSQKKEKERKKMIDAIQKGDKVLTIGGMYGTVVNIKDGNTIVLKIGDSTKVEIVKSAIQAKIS